MYRNLILITVALSVSIFVITITTVKNFGLKKIVNVFAERAQKAQTKQDYENALQDFVLNLKAKKIISPDYEY